MNKDIIIVVTVIILFAQAIYSFISTSTIIYFWVQIGTILPTCPLFHPYSP